MALPFLYNWAPFSIDALGLVTMLGSVEIEKAVGRLVENPWTEFLPFLGGFTIAGNQFTLPIPGAVLYNVSDGIVATDISGWFVRWMCFQQLQWNTSTLVWGYQQRDHSPGRTLIQSLIIGTIINGGILALCLLIKDWFGLANTLALVASIAVRWFMLRQNKKWVDCLARRLPGYGTEFVKVFCLLPDGKAVTIYAPRGLVTDGFLTTPKPYSLLSYRILQGIGWFSFGIHVICIGQATLFIQILTVVVMVSSTITCIFGLGCDEHSIGKRLRIHWESTPAPKDDRIVAYAKLNLSSSEEDSMLAWGLFPQKSNRAWWHRYKQYQLAMPVASATECRG